MKNIPFAITIIGGLFVLSTFSQSLDFERRRHAAMLETIKSTVRGTFRATIDGGSS